MTRAECDGAAHAKLGAVAPPPPAEPLLARRITVAAAALAVAAGLIGLAWQVLAAGGWTAWEAATLVCLTLYAPWLGLSAATAATGILVRALARDPDALVLPGLRALPPGDPAPALRTLVAVCVRLERMQDVLPPLDALLAALRAGPGGEHFALGILSDTPDGAEALAEGAAAAALAARHPEGAVLYRRRFRNDGYKAGNVMDFLDRHAAGFDAMLLLDADSRMTPATVRRLVAVMQADPSLAILQPTFGAAEARTPLARILGLGFRQGTRLWATGQAWWQGPCGPFWGHNALIRIAPFRAHCRLDKLPNGADILSHDHVEAARLHAAGWGVRVWPEDLGSAEQHPPDLIALFRRDLRWAEGNFQYLHLLRRRDLGRIGRMQMLQAILHYALAPVCFGFLPLAAFNAASGGGEGTPRGALLGLIAAGYGVLLLPKLAGYTEALLRAPPGARGVLARGMTVELWLALLLDSIAAFDRSATVFRLLLGRRAGWAPQERGARSISWKEALRRFGPHTLAGSVLLAAFLSAGWFATAVALPFVAGLALAVPLCVWTGRPDPVERDRAPATEGSAATVGSAMHGTQRPRCRARTTSA